MSSTHFCTSQKICISRVIYTHTHGAVQTDRPDMLNNHTHTCCCGAKTPWELKKIQTPQREKQTTSRASCMQSELFQLHYYQWLCTSVCVFVCCHCCRYKDVAADIYRRSSLSVQKTNMNEQACGWRQQRCVCHTRNLTHTGLQACVSTYFHFRFYPGASIPPFPFTPPPLSLSSYLHTLR